MFVDLVVLPFAFASFFLSFFLCLFVCLLLFMLCVFFFSLFVHFCLHVNDVDSGNAFLNTVSA